MSLLNEQQLQQISAAVAGLSASQLAWVSGYLSGLSHSNAPLAAASALAAPAEQATGPKTTILYGSQTGNGKALAERLYTALRELGAEVQLSNMLDYRTNQLKKEQQLILVVSTHGNGEPPDEARGFHRFIFGDRAPKLDSLRYAVLALGDSSYDDFCQTGVELDERLASLGASRLLDRVDCDVDYADDAAAWQAEVLKNIERAPVAPLVGSTHTAAPVAASSQWSEQNPYSSELLSHIDLTTDESEKDVLHLELSLEDSGLAYQPGDILAIVPENSAQLVEAVLAAAELSADDKISLKGNNISLGEALLKKLDLTTLTRKLVTAYAEASGQDALAEQAADKAQLVDFIRDADVLDLLTAWPGKIDAQAFAGLLRPLMARQYSIASSAEAHPDEVHVLVKRVEYEQDERSRYGVCSNWLARLQAGDQLPVYIKPNSSFKLPEDDQARVIMVGAGTGVAPFRSFLFEREARGISGNSWLFFGEQHFRSDFLYQVEWQNFLKTGVLERMSVAFSRDQEEKIYVQHRLLEEAKELYQWLQDGAYFYICGDMNHMARDVHNALLQIAVEQGGKTEAQAEAWLDQLVAERRYQRDVY